jgi:hypothetical protein
MHALVIRESRLLRVQIGAMSSFELARLVIGGCRGCQSSPTQLGASWRIVFKLGIVFDLEPADEAESDGEFGAEHDRDS